MPVTCERCASPLTPKAKFCAECGAPLVSRVSKAPKREGGAERRQVTVLFADIAGYTRMSTTLDPEELHALLGRYFAVVDSIVRDFGGTVDKHIGDAVMGVFGAPVSHGNDPERAVRAALAVHVAMQELSAEIGRTLAVHIGLASGEVLAAPTGSDVHREYTVLGDAVNLASRLDGVASAGETVISAGVYQSVAALVEAEAGGEVAVKGLSEPVRIWRLMGLRELEVGQRSPIVGRDAELDAFRKVLEVTARTLRGSVLFVRGEPGVGKTRLTEELRALAKPNYDIHSGWVLDFGTTKGQDAVRALVLSALGVPVGATPGEREQAAQHAIARELFREDEQPFAYDLLDLPQPAALRSLYDALSEETRATGRSEAVASLLQRSAGRRPVLVTVEDVHWADSGTLATLAALAGRTRSSALLLVMTSRIDGDPIGDGWRALADHVDVTVSTLMPLSESAARQLAEQVGAEAPDRIAACVERSGGNPLFLEQLLRSDARGALPDSVQSVVQARIDRLDPADKHALQAASVLGQRFTLDILRHLVVDPTYRVDALEMRGLLRPTVDGWMFAHALVRDGVYSSLVRQAKRDLHSRAATWFGLSDPVLRAEHLDRGDDRAAPLAYLAAANSLLGDFEYERALGLLQRGAAIAKERAELHALALAEGEIRLHRGDAAQARAAFERAIESATSDLEVCHALVGEADACRIVESVARGHEALNRAEQLAQAQNLDAELSRIHRIRGSLEFVVGADARATQGRALEHALRAGRVELEARALSCLGDAHYAAGRMQVAYDYFGRCIDLCRKSGLGGIELYQYYMLGAVRMFLGDPRGGLNAVEYGIEAAVRTGHRRAEMISRETAALILLELGDFERVLDHVDAALELAHVTQSRLFEAVVLAQRAEALRWLGRTDEAHEAARLALEVYEPGRFNFGTTIVHASVAHLAPEAEAVEILDRADALVATSGALAMVQAYYARASEACLTHRLVERARSYANRALGVVSEPATYIDLRARTTLCLCDFIAGLHDDSLCARASELLDDASRMGFGAMASALQTALAQGR